MNRRLLAMLVAASAMMPEVEPLPLPVPPRAPEPHAADALPLSCRDSEKIRAAEAKRARRAAKRRKA